MPTRTANSGFTIGRRRCDRASRYEQEIATAFHMLSRRPRPRFRITIAGPQTLRAISTQVIMKPRFWSFVAMVRFKSDRATIHLYFLAKSTR
jgi:plasmid stabilization system protein ParE